MVWLYIAIIMIMRIVQSIFSKANANILPKNGYAYIKYTIYYLLIAGILALSLVFIDLLNGASLSNIGSTILYASISGIALAISCCCSLYALSNGTMVLNSLFSTAGLLVPAIAGIFLFNEYLSIWQWIAIVIFVIGAYFLVGNSKKVYGKFSLKTLVVLIATLLSNGLTMVMQSLFGRNVENGNVSLFSFVSFFAGSFGIAIIFLIIFIIVKKDGFSNASESEFSFIPQNEKLVKLEKKNLIFGLALAIAVFIINQFATISTPLISPVILFAFINGGATIISAIVGFLMYKEKPNWQSILGIVLGLGSLIMIKVLA